MRLAPPGEWFGLLAKAGKAVTGADSKDLGSACACLRSAQKDKREPTDMEIPNTKIECKAFTLGDGTNISIWIGDASSASPALNER
jgi:hypothetical protein